jgi:RNA polymerase sigma factor (sigma-70 family)
MAKARLLRTLLRQVKRLRGSPGSEEVADVELLTRFVHQGDEAAFELLVWRHGPAVLNLCRRVLRHAQDAEDAFQATFLLLVLKARSVRQRAALGSWLYKVALRVALQARARAAARAARERHDLAFPLVTEHDEPATRDLHALLHEEVQRLPEKYRLVVVLCYLCDQSTEQAAAALGCPRGTVLSRLAEARTRLRRRLRQRGVELPVAALAAVLAQTAVEAGPALVEATVEAATCVAAGNGEAAGVPGSVLLLMEGVLNTMYWTKVKATVLVVVTLLLLGLAFWPRTTASVEAQDQKDPPVAKRQDEGTSKRHEPERPIGVWERSFDGEIRMVLTVERDRLSMRAVVQEDKAKYTIVGEADYSVTKDGILYGVVTSIGVPEDADQDTELALLCIDRAFSLRYRVDGDVLTIKEVYVGLGDDKNKQDDETMYLIGRWKRKGTAAKEEDPAEPRSSGKREAKPERNRKTRAPSRNGAPPAVPSSPVGAPPTGPLPAVGAPPTGPLPNVP